MGLKEDILARVDFGEYFAANIRGWKLGGNGEQGTGFCPFPEHEDKQQSFSGSAKSGYWRCFGCGRTGDYFTLWAFFNNRSIQSEFKEILAAIADEIGIRGAGGGEDREGGGRPAVPPTPKPESKPPTDPIPELIWKVLRADMTPELRRELAKLRGLEETTLERFDIGYDKIRRRFAIPVRDEKGVLRNIRLYSAVSEPKMLNWWHHECPECKMYFREVIKGKDKTNFCPNCSKELPKSAYKSFGEVRLFPLNEFAKGNYTEFLFCEGEFDSLMLWERGIQTLTGTGGASTLKREWLDTFAGKSMVMILDCDPPGIEAASKHAQVVLKDGRIPKLKVVRLPLAGTKQEKDITDWFKLGRTTVELLKVIKDAKALTPPKPEPKAEEDEDSVYHVIAEQFLRSEYCMNLGVCSLRNWRNTWYMWNGKFYNQILTSDVKYMLAGFLRRYPGLLKKKSLVSLANDVFMAAVDRIMVQSGLEPPVIFDVRKKQNLPLPDVVNFKNGLLDLNKAQVGEFELKKHGPEYFVLNCLPFDFQPEAKCPTWAEFLEYCWPDPEVRQSLQEFAGLCLIPDVEYQCFMVLLGEGGTGKSTFVGTISKLLGPDSVSHASLHQLGQQFGLSVLLGKLLNIAGEISDVEIMGEGILKAIVGGDSVVVERKFKEALNVKLSVRMAFAANQVPKFLDKSAGLWRKMVLIPCDVVVPPEKRDIGLMGKLEPELPGIFMWAMEGLKKLKTRKSFFEPKAVLKLKEESRQELNPARIFFDDFLAAVEGKEVKSAGLYSKYAVWCQENGYRSLNDVHLGKELVRYYGKAVEKVRLKVAGKREYIYRGICFLDELSVIPEEKNEQQRYF